VRSAQLLPQEAQSWLQDSLIAIISKSYKGFFIICPFSAAVNFPPGFEKVLLTRRGKK